jgi:hypothetical protein
LSDDLNDILTAFAAITLIMMLCTIVVAFLCIANFNKGLRTYTMPEKRIPEEAVSLRFTPSSLYLPHSPRMDLD